MKSLGKQSAMDPFYVLAKFVSHTGSRKFVNNKGFAECKQFGLFLCRRTIDHQSLPAPPLIVQRSLQRGRKLQHLATRHLAKVTKDQKIGRLIFFCSQDVKFLQPTGFAG